MHEPSSTPGDILFVGRRFRVVRREQHCGDGEIRMREVIEHPGSVVIVPLTACGDVCLVEVVRTAVGATLLELPAGTLDRPEPPADAAVRELAEETGYRVGRITPLGGFWMSPGVLRERMHLFLAEDLTAGPQALEPGEEIRTREVPWLEAVAMCLDGRIEDAKSVAGLLLVDRLFSGPRGPDAGGVGPAARFNPGEQAGPQRCAREESSPDGGR